MDKPDRAEYIRQWKAAHQLTAVEAEKIPCRLCKLFPRTTYDSICLKCRAAKQRIKNKLPHHRAWRKRYLRRLRRENNEGLLEKDRRNFRVQQERRPEAAKARYTLRHAIISGRVVKEKWCEVCGRKPRRLEGHHYAGYNQPLVVKWLCVPCHRFTHKALREALKTPEGGKRA